MRGRAAKPVEGVRDLLIGSSATAMLGGVDQLVRRNLRGVWVRGDLPVGPAVWAANHHSWWDFFVALVALRAEGRRDVGVLMDAANIGNTALFERAGAIGAHRLRAAVDMVQGGSVLVVFPEGELRAAGPLGEVRPGARWLADRAGVPLLTVATRVLLRGQQAPEAYLDIGAAGGDQDLAASLRERLAGLDEDLRAADPEQPLDGFRRVVTGVRSWNERFATLGAGRSEESADPGASADAPASKRRKRRSMTVRTAERGAPRLPQPRRTPVWGHLSQWVADPLDLVERGARLGSVFELRLWRRAVVGVGPDWNRLVLGDLDRFRSRGSMSQLSPYLSAGVVAMDGPQHGRRRAELNPAFHRRMVTADYTDRLAEIVAARLPVGTFDAVHWSSGLVREMLTAVFVGPEFPAEVLASFVAPLDRDMPAPLLRRPFRLRRMERALTRSFQEPAAGTLAEVFAGLDAGGVEEARVAIAAAYDTTAHSLAFALWELANRPELNEAAAAANVVSETLRLYPSGWIGSRVCSTATEFDGYLIPAGRLVIYSPYLTHRSPELWTDPLLFRPERFDGPLPAWGYLPFSAGARTCLGAALATLMLRTAVAAFAGSSLRRVTADGSDAQPRGGLTLAPRGPVLLSRGLG